jgi:hypothetical protein
LAHGGSSAQLGFPGLCPSLLNRFGGLAGSVGASGRLGMSVGITGHRVWDKADVVCFGSRCCPSSGSDGC